MRPSSRIRIQLLPMTTTVKSELLSFEEARQVVEQRAAACSPTQPELMNLLDALGLALAEDLRADRDFPPFPRATRDGYAVRTSDVQKTPATLLCVASIPAGSTLEVDDMPHAGEAVEIMTGAPVPLGADAVVMVEYTEAAGENVTIKRAVRAGENIVARGSEAERGDMMVAKGKRVQQAVVAVAAAVGRPE